MFLLCWNIFLKANQIFRFFPKLNFPLKKDHCVLKNICHTESLCFRKKIPRTGDTNSRSMRIVGPIQFWRGCVIYRSAPKSGLGPRKNADSVHAKVGTRSTAKMLTRFTPEHMPVFRALLVIEIELRNTSSFLRLYLRLRLRSRSNSGTHPCF